MLVHVDAKLHCFCTGTCTLYMYVYIQCVCVCVCVCVCPFKKNINYNQSLKPGWGGWHGLAHLLAFHGWLVLAGFWRAFGGLAGLVARWP